MKKLPRLFFLVAIAQLAFYACSSTKSREDQGVIAKAWHNTNAHFNGYFNAREIMDESMLALSEQHVDNYNQRLKLFPFLDTDNAGSVNGELDRAIEKVAVVVKKHPYSNWTDDSYLLVGQAQLIKQDYESAERTLNFTVTEFRPRPKRKKTKKGERPEEEDEFESKREVEPSQGESRAARLRARRDAQRERQRTIKQRQKEAKQAQKERERERKAKIRARKKGIRLPSKKVTPTDTLVAGLENEPEPETGETAELEEGPIGMISIFSNRNEADRGGSGEYGKKPGPDILKHRPAYQEARLWLAWALVKRDNFDRAQIILEDLRNDRGTYAGVRRQAVAVQAYLYLEQERLEEAIPYLEAAAELANERNERARYYYIAGQLYQELQQPAGARGAFEQVVAAKPAYEFELGARINMAKASYLSGSGDPDDAIRTLERMAKEEKNLEYESQLFYAMAGIAMQSGDEEAGAEYLRRALASPYGGDQTRVEAYQLLGDLAYDQGDYLPAKLYYDSTLQVMLQGDERLAGTTDRRDRLTDVAGSLETITLQDSLLRIGLRPEAERRRWAEEVFELRRATNSAANYSTPAVQGSINVNNAAASAGPNNGSAFWGYDNQTIRRGSRDFERRFGDRPLEDNWRRSNRTDVSLFVDEDDNIPAGELTNQERQIITDEEIEAILADVPTDEERQNATRRQLADAYFTLGRAYRDRIEDIPSAIEALTTLDQDFPGSDHESEAWYYLYLMHSQEGNNTAADRYAQKLREKYPDSKLARLANDPNYAQQLVNAEGERTREYEQAYTAFQDKDYTRARRLIQSNGVGLEETHPLKARYDLLQAMTSGKLDGRAAYVTSLEQVVRNHRGTPEETRAKEILRLLGEAEARLPGRGSEAGSQGGDFRPSKDEIHYVLIVFENSDVRLNEQKVELEAFNDKYNKLDRIRATPIFIGRDNEIPVLVLRRFKTGEEAMKYYGNVDSHRDEFLARDDEAYTVLPVSQSNYREILKARSFAGYEDWFRENYF